MTSIEWLWEQIDGIIPYQDINTSQLFNGVLEQAKEMHKQEIEISDENITKQSWIYEPRDKFDAAFLREAFIRGAEWYREQLKQNL